MTSWKLGDRVEHDTFGPGIILEVNDQHIVIRFDNHGRKRFASHLVQLRPHQPRHVPAAARARPVATPSPSPPPPAVSSPEALMDLARQSVNSEESLNGFVSRMRRALPGAMNHHVGITSGMRVQQFQNWLLDENAKHQLTDAQLLAVMRVEFPLASGEVFVGDVDAGLKLVSGIRAHYNRDGLSGPSAVSRGLPESLSYGSF